MCECVCVYVCGGGGGLGEDRTEKCGGEGGQL